MGADWRATFITIVARACRMQLRIRHNNSHLAPLGPSTATIPRRGQCTFRCTSSLALPPPQPTLQVDPSIPLRASSTKLRLGQPAKGRRCEHLHARQGQLAMGMVRGGAHDGAAPPTHWAPEGSKFGTAELSSASIFCEMDVLIHQRHACTQRLRELGQACKGAAARGAGGAADVEPLRRALAQYDAERRQEEERHSYWWDRAWLLDTPVR